MPDQKAIFHIVEDLSLLGNSQMGVQTNVDGELGFRMWGGKDASGALTQWLAKGKAGSLTTLKLTGPTTTSTAGVLQHDSDGNVYGGTLDPAYIPDHDSLNGVEGSGPEYNHLSDAELVLLTLTDGSKPFTAPVGGVDPVAASDLATKNYVDNAIPAIPAHNALSGLQGTGPEYNHLSDAEVALLMLKDGSVAFTAEVSGVDPTAAAHLATKSYVDSVAGSGPYGFRYHGLCGRMVWGNNPRQCRSHLQIGHPRIWQCFKFPCLK